MSESEQYKHNKQYLGQKADVLGMLLQVLIIIMQRQNMLDKLFHLGN